MIRFRESVRMRFVQGAPAPRVIVIVPATIVHFIMVLGWAWAVFTFQPYGNRQWAAATIALVLVYVAVRLNWNTQLARKPPTPAERVFGRSLWLGRSMLAGVLACWLALVVWSAFSCGGALPPAKSERAAIRVLTWNILHGTERGLPWSRYDWASRKSALKTALGGTKPDILCVQEALANQLQFLAETLPSHTRVGVGRDDGGSAGEHCAIFFDASRFVELSGGTFWLEEPTDQPPIHTILGPKRICTRARLRDLEAGGIFRVYNSHQYMTERARLNAMRLIASRMSEGEAGDALILAGDFNSPPDAPDRRLLARWDLRSSAELAGASATAPTYQFYGIRLRNLDDILVDRVWRVVGRHILDVKPANTFPSDHFGVMADLILDSPCPQSPPTASRVRKRFSQAAISSNSSFPIVR
jgi:endonuclease/exonuclease/phosphatase family metal-dependent hydrolase